MAVLLHVASWNVFTEVLSGKTYAQTYLAVTARQTLEDRLSRLLIFSILEAASIRGMARITHA
jgi:hypothetical protein